MWKKQMKKMMNYLYDRVKTVNDSKIFAGLVILTMNLSSKLIPLPMSKTVESIVKYHFSQYILVFAISWIGTRDIFIALIVTSIFGLLMEFLFNESLITRARNLLTHNFLNSQASHLFFIDSDIKFSANDVLSMISADKDVICGVYPKKEINW